MTSEKDPTNYDTPESIALGVVTAALQVVRAGQLTSREDRHAYSRNVIELLKGLDGVRLLASFSMLGLFTAQALQLLERHSESDDTVEGVLQRIALEFANYHEHGKEQT